MHNLAFPVLFWIQFPKGTCERIFPAVLFVEENFTEEQQVKCSECTARSSTHSESNRLLVTIVLGMDFKASLSVKKTEAEQHISHHAVMLLKNSMLTK